MGNLVHRDGIENDSFQEIKSLINVIKDPPCDLVIVTNELGMGVVPENAMARYFRDLVGSTNREIARLTNQVVMMVSGLPLFLKEEK